MKNKIDLDEKMPNDIDHPGGDFHEWLAERGGVFLSCEEGRDRIWKGMLDLQKAVEHMYAEKELDDTDYELYLILQEKLCHKIFPSK